MLVLFTLNNKSGSSLDDVVEMAQSIDPSKTSEGVNATLMQGIKSGIFRTLRPPLINYTMPQIRVFYTFNEAMDRSNHNITEVSYLIALCGGVLCGPYFKQFFKTNVVTQNTENFLLYKNEILL